MIQGIQMSRKRKKRFIVKMIHSKNENGRIPSLRKKENLERLEIAVDATSSLKRNDLKTLYGLINLAVRYAARSDILFTSDLIKRKTYDEPSLKDPIKQRIIT
jgi:hypothetical protein